MPLEHSMPRAGHDRQRRAQPTTRRLTMSRITREEEQPLLLGGSGPAEWLPIRLPPPTCTMGIDR